MRKTFIDTLTKMARKDKNIMILVADIGFSVFDKFKKEMPGQYFNMGIAEQSTISIAAGLALSGKIVYVYSITPFITMRCFEQIRNDLSYQKLNVKIIGVGSGFSYGEAGISHHAIVDLSIMRSLPNMSVTSPATKEELKQIMLKTKKHNGPMYIRISKTASDIDERKKKIVFGKANKIEYNNSKIGIFVTGSIIDKVHELNDLLKKENIKADIVSFHTIKPIDKEFIVDESKKKKVIITVEEHSIIGGLGSAVSEIIAESGCDVVFERFGVNDKYFSIVGDMDYLLELSLLSPAKMLGKIKKLLNSVR